MRSCRSLVFRISTDDPRLDWLMGEFRLLVNKSIRIALHEGNAALNILRVALASDEALARAVRFQPGALRGDVVSPLYDLPRGGAGARDESSGVELGVM